MICSAKEVDPATRERPGPAAEPSEEGNDAMDATGFAHVVENPT